MILTLLTLYQSIFNVKHDKKSVISGIPYSKNYRVLNHPNPLPLDKFTQTKLLRAGGWDEIFLRGGQNPLNPPFEGGFLTK